MHKRSNSLRRALQPLFLLTAVAYLASPVAAQQQPPPVAIGGPIVRVNEENTYLEVVEKAAKVIELEHKITRVDGFDDAVVHVSALKPNQIHIQALTQGITTVTVSDEHNQTFSVEVFVKGDCRHLQAIIDTKFPNAAIEAFKVRDSVALRGWVTQPEQINQIIEISEQFYPMVLNQIKVGGVQQVLLQVKIAEVQRSKIRQMGMNFLAMNRSSYFTSTPGELVKLSEVALPFGGPPAVMFDSATLGNSTMSLGITSNNAIFNGFFEALKEEGLAKILAEPELVTTNGRPATILSGGEFPILVPQSLGTVTIEWKEFGVRLEAVPIILGNGQLRLELQPEVSERDFTNAVDVNGTTVPGLTTRRVNTQVEMKFGQTLMIGGLIATRKTAETDKIPFLGELPWIGAAFRKIRYDDVETDLVVLVTPQLVAPLDADQVLEGAPGDFTDSPTDRELFGHGMIEIPKYGDACGTCQPMSTDLIIPGTSSYPGTPGASQPMPPPAPESDETVLPDLPDGGQSALRDRRSLESQQTSTVSARTRGRHKSIRPVGFREMGRSTAGLSTNGRHSSKMSWPEPTSGAGQTRHPDQGTSPLNTTEGTERDAPVGPPGLIIP
jgi:pilus assembly protein CpaC